jgi:hypothetical protein
MYQSLNSQRPPDKLTEYLQTSLDQSARALRRRAVLTRSADDNWLLVCCTVDAFPDSRQRPDLVAPRHYPQAVLYEDWLTAEDCRKFIDDVQNGQVTFGTVRIERKANPTWRMEILPLKNSSMARAGFCVGTRFEENFTGTAQGPLLASGAPYYPDLTEAARDWLPFTVYHGESDARNHDIIFLLPEARAFFTNAESHAGILEVSIEGTDAEQLSLIVKGAYWQHGSIRHFQNDVKAGRARMRVPDDMDRLEYVLMDSKGAVYDFQREDRFNHSGLGRKRVDRAARDLVQQVRTACLEGEGVQIEFKPFIDCDQAIGPKNRKTKLRELVTTIVAFANTQGGRIYIGIDDECGLSSIGPDLQRWAKAEVSEDVAERYRGALTGKIRNQVIGDLPMRVSHTLVDDALVVIIDVSQSAAKPVVVRDDNLLYVRAGASNKQLSPNQWESVLAGKDSEGLFPYGAR